MMGGVLGLVGLGIVSGSQKTTPRDVRSRAGLEKKDGPVNPRYGVGSPNDISPNDVSPKEGPSLAWLGQPAAGIG
jgi:hypothetical protein